MKNQDVVCLEDLYLSFLKVLLISDNEYFFTKINSYCMNGENGNSERFKTQDEGNCSLFGINKIIIMRKDVRYWGICDTNSK